MLTISLAIGVRSRDWLALAFVMVRLTAALPFRLHVEQIALRDAFDTEYLDYSKSTRRLIPGV